MVEAVVVETVEVEVVEVEVEAALVEETTKLWQSMRRRRTREGRRGGRGREEEKDEEVTGRMCWTRRGNKRPSPAIQLQLETLHCAKVVSVYYTRRMVMSISSKYSWLLCHW